MMKKILFIFVLILLSLMCRAPELSVLHIIMPDIINSFEPLVKAITYVESCDGKYTYNKAKNSVGWFQIRQIRVDDYNQRTGSNYKLENFYDYKLSRKMFLYYASGKTFEQAAKRWNGSGPKTIKYWSKVQITLKILTN